MIWSFFIIILFLSYLLNVNIFVLDVVIYLILHERLIYDIEI
jgi:hypothetical protein